MFRQLTFDEFKVAATEQKRAVVFREFPCDDLTPIQAFLALASKDAALLESGVKDAELGRYSVLALEPYATFQSKNSPDAFEKLRETVQSFRLPDCDYPSLVGGAIGCVSYDAVRILEKIPDRHEDRQLIPDVLFLFHAIHLVFDHAKSSLLISVNVSLTGDLEKDYFQAQAHIESLRKRLKTPLHLRKASCQTIAFKEEMSDAEFCEKVQRAQDYIRQGEAFQIVLSRGFESDFTGNPFDVYRALRMTNPSPFMFYLQTEDFAIAGSSPERLVKLTQGRLQTVPIAGTRLRIIGKEAETVKELINDPKEEAEHMMLVDLGRNDLGVVAKVGSVQVKQLKAARYFPHVIHLVSEVEAEIAEGFDAIDALKAVFPAGTLSGAPKIRAMQIIDELEVSRRGLYGGAFCTIDNRGDFDSCIAIRTAFFQRGTVSVRTGAGIVFDSDPKTEAEETRAKAKGVIDAIKLASSGVL